MFITKKKKICDLEAELEKMRTFNNELLVANNDMSHEIIEMKSKFPFDLGQVVYDVQLRSAKGRFTKIKPSIEHSLINEVIVDKRNYFSLVERYNNRDVFITCEAAETHLKDVCVDWFKKTL